MKKLWRSATVLTCLLVLALGMTVCAAEATILKGITIEGVDVSGMTKDQAISALEAYETKLGEEILKLKIGNNELDAPLSSFGVTYSNEDAVTSALRVGRTGNIVKRYKDQKDLQHSGMNYTLSRQANKEMVKVYVEETCTQYDQPAKNASLSRENGAFTFVPGEQGVEMGRILWSFRYR